MYVIFQNGVEINRIVADETFVEKYCARNGYTYEKLPDLEPIPEPEPEIETEPTAEELIDILLGVNRNG